LGRKAAIIKNGKVKSVHVSGVWTEILIAIPTAAVVRRGKKRNLRMPKAASIAETKAAVTKRKKKEALAATAALEVGS
jgi:hypothetical protein